MTRLTIEALARKLMDEPGTATIWRLADKYGEPPVRIMDAMDVLKIRAGQATQVPPVNWPRGG